MKKTQTQLKQELTDAATHVEVGGIYAHYKDSSHTYRVDSLAINTDGDGVCVIYRALYDEQLTFVRSIEEWLDDAEKDGGIVRRFQLVR